MSKITILAVGSRGDINPACVLARALKESDYDVCLATHDYFQEYIVKQGLEFATIAGDYRKLLNSEVGFKTLEGKGSFRLISDDLFAQQIKDSWQACQGSKAIISFPLSFYGYHIAEAMQIPFITMSYFPLATTKEFPFLKFSSHNTNFLSRWLNPLSYRMVEFLIWRNDQKVNVTPP